MIHDAAIRALWVFKELCTRYLATIQSQKPCTKRRKEDIIKRLLAHFPDGPKCPVSNVRKSSRQSHRRPCVQHNHMTEIVTGA